MATFTIKTPSDMLNKLREEQQDLGASNWLSARHAINAALTAYHLAEWVWRGFASRRADLHVSWRLSSFTEKNDELRFFAFLRQQCPALAVAGKIANGSKHFERQDVHTGMHGGAFGGDFSRDFDVSYLWVDRSDLISGQAHGQLSVQRVEDFLNELVGFWEAFFSTYSVP